MGEGDRNTPNTASPGQLPDKPLQKQKVGRKGAVLPLKPQVQWLRWRGITLWFTEHRQAPHRGKPLFRLVLVLFGCLLGGGGLFS